MRLVCDMTNEVRASHFSSEVKMGRHDYVFQKFIKTEVRKIELDKYFEGIDIHGDPGQDFVERWIAENSVDWRKAWDASKCKHCRYWFDCGQELRTECSKFKFDKNEEDENEN